MSYILEALKKAERQRRLGQAPDIYAPSIADAEPVGGRMKINRRRWVFAAGLLLAASGMIWFGLWNTAPHQSSAPTANQAASQAEQNTQAPQASDTPDSALPASRAPGLSEPSVRKPDQQGHATLKAPAPREKEAQREAHAAPKTVAKPKKSKLDNAAHAGRRADGAPRASATVEETQLPTQHELPENIRQRVPAMVVNGYIYASNPAERSIVINNRLVHEGEQLMPGLVLEKMKPKEAIMNYEGFRYRLLY